MKRTDHILTLVATALTSKDPDPVLAIIRQYYAIDEIRKTNAVSLGAELDVQEVPLSYWLNQLRSEQVLKLVFIYNPLSGQTIQPHIAAAFAGASDIFIKVSTSKETSCFGMQSYRSPDHEISPDQFIQLINSQPDPMPLWARASALLLESNKLNNRTLFPADKAAEYIMTEKGAAVFDDLASDLFKEVQIEASIYEKEFIIPESLQLLFKKYASFFSTNDDREYVYLYPLRDVSAEDIIELVRAQTFGDSTWETLNKTLTGYADPEMPVGPVEEWPHRILAMDDHQLKRFVNPICRSICTLCEETNSKPVIPTELADSFGPDETEQKRAAARSRADKNLWVLQDASEPWEYYQLQPIESTSAMKVPDTIQTHESLMRTLTVIHQFAERLQSLFEEAFRLAIFIFAACGRSRTHETVAGKLIPGDYNEEHLGVLISQLIENGFSERAIENFKRTTWIGAVYKTLGWDDERITDMIAIITADVFGGMGSWNDQYFVNDTEEFDRLSAELYNALRKHFAAILSWSRL